MTSYRGVVAALAALAAMIAVTAGANLCPDFNQDFMCAVRINAVPVGFLQYAYASEVGGYEGYCTEVADNVFVDLTANVDKVYLDIIIAEYCDDTPIGAVSQYDNDGSSIARDEDVVLILKALSSTAGHIQASLDHATGLYRGPEIVTEFGSGANALGTCVKFALGLWIKGAEDCGTPECYNFYVFADKATCLADETPVVSGMIDATAPATSTSLAFQLGVHCLPLGHADVPPAELVCQGTMAGGEDTVKSEWESTLTDGSITTLSDGVVVKVDAGVGELYMQIGFEAATVLAGSSAMVDGGFWPISASFEPALELATTGPDASTLKLLDPSGSEIVSVSLSTSVPTCTPLSGDLRYYYTYANNDPGAQVLVFSDDLCNDLFEDLLTESDAATVTETHTRTVACTDEYEMPYIQCYRGYTENAGPGFDVIFNEKNIFDPGCATIYSETGSNPATRSVLIPDPDEGISFWDVEIYDSYRDTGVCGSGDSTQNTAAYEVDQVDDDTTHYNLGYDFSLTTSDNGDSTFAYDLVVHHSIGDTTVPTMWEVTWTSNSPQCLHLVDALWVNFENSDTGVTGSDDVHVHVYADNSCSELIVNELFSFRTTTVVSETRTISISFVCEDKDLNEDVFVVEVDDGPDNDSGGSSCNDGVDNCGGGDPGDDLNGSGCDGGVDTDCVPRTQLTYRQAGTSTNERFSTVDGALCFPVFTHSSGTGVYYLYFEDETNTFFTDNGCEIPAALPASPNSDDGVYYDWEYTITMSGGAPMALDLDFALVTTSGPDSVDRSLTMGPGDESCVNVPDSDIWLTTSDDVIMIFHGEASCFSDYFGSINYQFFEVGTVRTGTFQIDIDVFDPNSYSSANVAGDPHFFVRHPSSEAEGKDIVSVYDWKEVGHYHFLAFADHAVSLVVNEFAGCDGRMEGEYIASIAINTGGDTGAFGANSYHATCDAGITFANGTTAADNMLRVGTPCVTFLIVLDNGYLNIHEVVMSCKATGGVHALLEDHASANQAGWWEVKNGTFKLVADQAPKVVARRSPTRVIDLDL